MCGVAVNPGDCATHLLDHRKQAAGGIIDIDEIEDDVMRPGIDERLGQKGVIRGPVGAPGTAMNKDIDRRVAPSWRERCRASRSRVEP